MHAATKGHRHPHEQEHASRLEHFRQTRHEDIGDRADGDDEGDQHGDDDLVSKKVLNERDKEKKAFRIVGERHL